ncbi:MAG: DUF4190 domain-containing protein [Ignavibacteriae bacterium]|nr:DUF4190 domain-containing protein [Ignavibacteriota bacterium]
MNNNILYSQDGNAGGFQPPPPPPPPSGYAPPPPPPPPSYGGSQSQYTPSDKASNSAIWALILGIAAWVTCGILTAVPAWIIGKKELNAIAAGQSAQAGKGMAQVGMWLGIIQVILGVIAIFVIMIIVVIGLLSSTN